MGLSFTGLRKAPVVHTPTRSVLYADLDAVARPRGMIVAPGGGLGEVVQDRGGVDQRRNGPVS